MTASLLVAAYIAFAATSIDDLIIVTTLFTSSRITGLPRPTTIVMGQYVGFVSVVGVSLLAAAGLQGVSDRWVGMFGLIPIAFGVRGLWRYGASRRNSDETSRPPLASSVPGIAAITFANGADNLGVFTPLFGSVHPMSAVLTATGILVLVGVLCALGALLGTQRAVVATLGRVSHWVVPLVFIAIGVLILTSTGAIDAITDILTMW